jgi:hypothetical protein
MKRKTGFRLLTTIVCVVMLMTSMSSCAAFMEGFLEGLSQSFNNDQVTTYVRGGMDLLYHGTVDEEYLELVLEDEAELRAAYEENVEYNAYYFCYYYGILAEEESLADLDADLQKRLVDQAAEILKKTKYEVQTATKQDEETYVVEVIVSPVDVFVKLNAMCDSSTYEPLNQILAESESLDWENMSDEDYWDFSNRYGNIMADMVDRVLPELSYADDQSIIVRVELVDGSLEINDYDFGNIDAALVLYP